MTRFFFDISNGRLHRDAAGSEWTDLQAASTEAVRLFGEILKEMPEQFWKAPLWSLTLSDEARRPVLKLEMAGQMASVPLSS